MMFCIRGSDEPGPADLVQLGGETAGLHHALCSEWEDGHSARRTAPARPAAIGGLAPGRSAAGCSSAGGLAIFHRLCRKRHRHYFCLLATQNSIKNVLKSNSNLTCQCKTPVQDNKHDINGLINDSFKAILKYTHIFLKQFPCI